MDARAPGVERREALAASLENQAADLREMAARSTETGQSIPIFLLTDDPVLDALFVDLWADEVKAFDLIDDAMFLEAAATVVRGS